MTLRPSAVAPGPPPEPGPPVWQLIVWRMAYLLVQGGSSVAVVAIVAATTSAAAAGAFVVAQGTVVAVQTIADVGVSQAASTWLAGARERDPALGRDLHATMLAGGLRTSLVAVALTALSALLFLGDPDVPVTLLATAPVAGCALALAAVDGTLRAAGDVRRPVRFVLLSRGGMLLGVGLGVLLSERAPVIAGVCSAATVLASLPALAHLWRGRARKAVWRRHRRELVAACAPIATSQAAVVLTARITTPLAAGIAGVLAAGAFEVAWRLFQVGQYLLGGPLSALAPRIAREQARGERTTLRRALGAAFVVGCAAIPVVLLVAPLASRLTGGDLAPGATDSLRILACATPFALLALPASFALAARGPRARWLLAATAAAGAAANVALTLALPSTGLDVAVGPAAGCVVSGLALAGAALRPGRGAVVAPVAAAPTTGSLATATPGTAAPATATATAVAGAVVPTRGAGPAVRPGPAAAAARPPA